MRLQQELMEYKMGQVHDKKSGHSVPVSPGSQDTDTINKHSTIISFSLFK